MNKNQRQTPQIVMRPDEPTVLDRRVKILTENSKGGIAREYLLGIQPFKDIVAWEAKDGKCYELLRAMPALLKIAEENVIAGC